MQENPFKKRKTAEELSGKQKKLVKRLLELDRMYFKLHNEQQEYDEIKKQLGLKIDES